MTDLATLEVSTFTPLIGETFRVRTADREIELVLHEASALGKAVRQGGAFSLVFRGDDGLEIAQQLCPVHHRAIGEISLFLVPIGPLGEGMGFEAVFT
ncbi:hypothetical protein C8N35_10566 [Breoghania corrubedonensis]|uniref:DUF6916 domain-containing protein n=1 Tax=Breoghania corrubedonensis TaxID=665038 RepID=A0A2T5V8I2_9HYPH|nr:hypothetical protein [Breoghania corrubedonensis]PTW60066.1 hypothetical protein C8N35_10566 [Breoghania corrubedonensis]